MNQPNELVDLVRIKAEIAKIYTDNGHSLISPSGYATWTNCSGAMRGLMDSRKTSPDNTASIEGTTAHFILEASLLKWQPPSLYSGAVDGEMVDEIHSWYDKIVSNESNTSEVKEFALGMLHQLMSGKINQEFKTQLDKCYARVKAYKDNGWTVIPESHVSLERYLDHTFCDGTSDIIMFKDNEMKIVDLKYGKGIEVSPDNNGQLKLYCVGALVLLEERYNIVPNNIELVIMQPRINNGVWKVFQTNYIEINHYIIEIRPKALEALKGIVGEPVKFNPALKTCEWCHRRANCNARWEEAKRIIARIYTLAGIKEGETVNEENLTPNVIGEILSIAPFVTALLASVEKEAYVRLSSGDEVPGCKLVRGRARRKWDGTEEDVAKRLINAGIDVCDVYATKTVSPAQADKVTMSNEQRQLSDSMIVKSYGKDVIASASDPRPMINKEQDVKDAFSAAGVVK